MTRTYDCACPKPVPSGRVYMGREACVRCGQVFVDRVGPRFKTKKYYGRDRAGRAVVGNFRPQPFRP